MSETTSPRKPSFKRALLHGLFAALAGIVLMLALILLVKPANSTRTAYEIGYAIGKATPLFFILGLLVSVLVQRLRYRLGK